jgi:hypothetical protein
MIMLTPGEFGMARILVPGRSHRQDVATARSDGALTARRSGVSRQVQTAVRDDDLAVISVSTRPGATAALLTA